MDDATQASPTRPHISKARTGVAGLDEITNGGLPSGRPTLVAGGPGSGKTLLGITFLVNGATQFNERGVLMTFEQDGADLATDVASLGFDLPALVAEKKLVVDYVHVDRSQIEETGEYDLEALFIRLEHAVKSIGAKRVVLDTIEALFSGLKNEAILRAELRRLFRWLRDHGLSTIITGERGETTLTRNGLEEYVTDAVILLDHRVHEQISTRRIRVVKYRGTHHGTNEYPFLIDTDGVSVLPVTSLGLEHKASSERVSTGLAELDGMLGGHGFFRGSTILVSGTAGTGKTTMAAHFTDAACRRGERCLYFLFEESPAQMIRNMQSAGINLQQWIDQGQLEFLADRPSTFGLETHLALVHRAVDRFKPDVVVVDPVTNLIAVGTQIDVRAMLTRLIDFLKMRNITALFTSLTAASADWESTDAMISSLMDSWVLTTAETVNHKRRRQIFALKSRGMACSDDVREFRFTDRGIEILPTAPDSLEGKGQ